MRASRQAAGIWSTWTCRVKQVNSVTAVARFQVQWMVVKDGMDCVVHMAHVMLFYQWCSSGSTRTCTPVCSTSDSAQLFSGFRCMYEQ